MGIEFSLMQLLELILVFKQNQGTINLMVGILEMVLLCSILH